MLVRFVGTAPMKYKGVKYFLGQELEVSQEFFNLHKSRLDEVKNDVIEAEFTEIKNVVPEETEIRNVKPKKTRRSKKAAE